MYPYIAEAKIGDTFLIPPDMVGEIIAFEWPKSAMVIDAMVNAVEQGCVFPAVPVEVTDTGLVYISACYYEKGWLVGGHHRALAHYIADNPLKVTRVCGNTPRLYPINNRRIKDIVFYPHILEELPPHTFKLTEDAAYANFYYANY